MVVESVDDLGRCISIEAITYRIELACGDVIA
jgi:hypothetical protein